MPAKSLRGARPWVRIAPDKGYVPAWADPNDLKMPQDGCEGWLRAAALSPQRQT
jgi:hypothetical protein